MIDDAAGFLLLLFCAAAAGGSAVAGDSSDAAALFAFKSAADPGNRLAFPAPSSNDSASHCRWPGVSCSPTGRVVGLVLVSSGITGFFGPGTLDRLDQLRILSLQDNSLAGPIPDLSPLLNLRAIFLGHNSFGGRFPPSILSLHRLRVLDLSGNHLAGPVPPALASLERLVALRLDSNRFDGSVPAFNQSSLKTLNVSFNNFSGEIPITAVLSSFAASSFAENPALCGKILRKECGGDAHMLFSHRGNDSHNSTSPAGANLGQNSRFNLPASSPSQKMHKKAVVAVWFLAIVAAAALGFLRVRGELGSSPDLSFFVCVGIVVNKCHLLFLLTISPLSPASLSLSSRIFFFSLDLSFQERCRRSVGTLGVGSFLSAGLRPCLKQKEGFAGSETSVSWATAFDLLRGSTLASS